MRSGDEGCRDPPVDLIARLPVQAVPRGIETVWSSVVPEAESQVIDRRRIHRRAFRERRELEVPHEREACIEEQAIGQRIRPRALHEMWSIEVVSAGFRCRRGTDEGITRTKILVGPQEGEFLLLRYLPGQPRRVIPDLRLLVSGPIVVGRIKRCIHGLVEPDPGLIFLRAPPPMRGVEPAPVSY